MLPPWFGPPETVLGVAVATHRVLARTDTVVIALVGLTAYPTGCTFDLDLAVRRTDQDMAVWEAWQAAVFEGHHAARRVLPPGAVPDELLRCGVQLADGSVATNVGQRPSESAQVEPSLLAVAPAKRRAVRVRHRVAPAWRPRHPHEDRRRSGRRRHSPCRTTLARRGGKSDPTAVHR